MASANGASPMLYIALVMIAAGLGFKIAAVPFHLWAPDTYEGAPAPAAAFIASVSKVASFALLISISHAILKWPAMLHMVGRVTFIAHSGRGPIPHATPGFITTWPMILVDLSVLSMIFGNLAALAQTSVRRLLAYSAIAHAGYILLGLAFFSWTDASAQAILYYIVTYGLTTIGAFGVVGVVERATGSDKLDAFLGLHKRNPVLAAILLVLFLSLAGIPPLVGFWAKFNLFAAVLSGGFHGFKGPLSSLPAEQLTLVALAIAFSAVSLYYYLQVLKRAYVMPAADETPIRANTVTMTVLIAIAIAVLVLGCFPALLQNWIAAFYPAVY
jgi:NADH-quinone oxidoreductase subunit N